MLRKSTGRILMPEIPDLDARLEELIGQIPPGRVATCGMLADALGDSAAARWVGGYTLHHPCAETGDKDCPCHRVVRAGGQLGGYASGDPVEKAWRLMEEGIEFGPEGVDLDLYGFNNFQTDRPLERLARFQTELAERIVSDRRLPRLEDAMADNPTDGENSLPRWIGGVDVSYVRIGRSAADGPGPELAAATYVLFSTEQSRPIWNATLVQAVRFPYLTGYLAFRELPPLLDLIERVRRFDRLAPVVLVDGSGRLHPRRAGIACNLGVAARVASIGVAKKLLAGRVESPEPLEAGRSVQVVDQEGEILGLAIRSSPRSRRSIYVSVGHGLDLETAERLVRTTLAGHRLPEPIRWADRLSREAARETQAAAIARPDTFDPMEIKFQATDMPE